MHAWFWIVGWFLSILTITGNGFIIILVCSKRLLRTKTNAFIVSLAVADVCVGMFVVPSLYFCGKNGCSWPRIWPSWVHWIRWLISDASVINLCILVLDRYIAVVKPLKYLTFMTHRRVIQMVCFSWGTTVVFILLEASLWLSFKTPIIPKIFIWLVTIFFHLLPCIMLVFCFLSMLSVVYQQARAAPTLGKQLRFNQRREKSALVMMAVVVGLFLVCYGIYLRCDLKNVLIEQKSCHDFYYKIPVLVLNSAVNPLAYAFFKRDIKNEIKRLICKVHSSTVHKLNLPVNMDNRFSVSNTTL